MKLTFYLKENFNHLLHLLYPNTCTGCQKVLLRDEKHFCNICHNAIKSTFDESDLSNIKNRLENHTVENIYTLYRYEKKGLSQRLINNIKYQNGTKTARYLGELLGEKMIHDKYDYLIPVPIHPKKLKKRGYNQALELCKGISKVTNTPILNNYLIKTSNNNSQTSKSRKKRWDNTEQVFSKQTALNTAKNILLVDDVLTSGATISACLKVIETKHITSVATVCVAMTKN